MGRGAGAFFCADTDLGVAPRCGAAEAGAAARSEACWFATRDSLPHAVAMTATTAKTATTDLRPCIAMLSRPLAQPLCARFHDRERGRLLSSVTRPNLRRFSDNARYPTSRDGLYRETEGPSG
jgi:hypothetical protein